jgi:excisionase family DNA binding protein
MWVASGKETALLKSVDGGGTAQAALPGRAVRPNPSGMLSNSGIGKRLLTVVEAAGYLGLQVDTVHKKARLRELPSVKVGRALRFDVKALERFVEQHTIETID